MLSFCVPVHCVPGEYLVAGTCTKCSVGTYKDSAGNEACDMCTGDFTTPGNGSTSAQDCSVGRYW